MRYEKQVRDGQERRSTKAPGPRAQWAALCAPREGGPGAARGSAARKGPRAGGTRAPSASGLSARRGHRSGREAEPLGRARHVRGKRRSQVLTDGAGTARAAPEDRARPGLGPAPRDAHSRPREPTGGAQEAPNTQPLKRSTPARVPDAGADPACRLQVPALRSPWRPAAAHAPGNATRPVPRAQFHLVSPSPSLLSSTKRHCLFSNLSAESSWADRNRKFPAVVL